MKQWTDIASVPNAGWFPGSSQNMREQELNAFAAVNDGVLEPIGIA